MSDIRQWAMLKIQRDFITVHNGQQIIKYVELTGLDALTHEFGLRPSPRQFNALERIVFNRLTECAFGRDYLTEFEALVLRIDRRIMTPKSDKKQTIKPLYTNKAKPPEPDSQSTKQTWLYYAIQKQLPSRYNAGVQQIRESLQLIEMVLTICDMQQIAVCVQCAGRMIPLAEYRPGRVAVAV